MTLGSDWSIAVPVSLLAAGGHGTPEGILPAGLAARNTLRLESAMALYVHDRNNQASARVCRSLGYVEYAEEYFSEY